MKLVSLFKELADFINFNKGYNYEEKRETYRSFKHLLCN